MNKLQQLKELLSLVSDDNQPQEVAAPRECFNDLAHSLIGQYCLFRTYNSGVHVGVLDGKNGQQVKIKNARRIYYWRGRFTLSAVANKGLPDGCKLSESLETFIVEQVIEIIPLDLKIVQQFTAYPSYKI